MQVLSDPFRFRRGATAACLLLAGAMILAGVLTSPDQGDGTTSSYLHSIATDSGATQLSAVLLHFGYLLLVPGAFGLLALLRTRAVALGHIAIAFAALGGITIAGNVVTDIYDLALAENLSIRDATLVADAAERYGAAAPLIVPAFAGSLIGFTLLAVAVWRAGWVSGWLPTLMGAAWLLFFVATPIGSFALFAALAVLALRVATTSPEEWSSSTPSKRAPGIAFGRAKHVK